MKLVTVVFFLLPPPLSTTASDPIVMERSQNRVEFGDLMLEYNRYTADESIKIVTLDLSLQYTKWSGNLLTTNFLMRQTWTDKRLKFHGTASVTPSDEIRVWQPDTVIENAIESSILSTPQHPPVISISPDGSIYKMERLNAKTPCEIQPQFFVDNNGQLNCTLTIGSAANFGVTRIVYEWSNLHNEATNAKFISNSTQDCKSFDGALFSRAFLHLNVQTPYTHDVLRFLIDQKEL